MSEAVRIRDTALVVCDANVFYSIVATDLISATRICETMVQMCGRGTATQ